MDLKCSALEPINNQTILPERAVVECRGSTVFPFKPSLDPLLFFFVSLQKSI